MSTIADAVAQIQAYPAPVFLIDTAALIDLFRADFFSSATRVQDLLAAADVLELASAHPIKVHLVVPELIPREYTDNADENEKEFDKRIRTHDENLERLLEAASRFAGGLPEPVKVHPVGLAAKIRKLADDLLGKAIRLDRDQDCLDRAVRRLINKLAPSHKKEMKDSMNIEQCLELSRQLKNASFSNSRVWVSPNKNDFAENGVIHSHLSADFTAAGLEYFLTFHAASARLRSRGEM